MNKIFLRSLLFFLLFTIAFSQYSKKSSKTMTPNKDNAFEIAINTILGGPHDAPISTRILNKAGHIISILIGSVGSIFAYFKWFRNRKNRS